MRFTTHGPAHRQPNPTNGAEPSSLRYSRLEPHAQGEANVVPCTFVNGNGAVGANVGKLCARTCVAASNPDASLISVGSLNAVPKKLIPKGTAYCVHPVGCVGDVDNCVNAGGTSTMGYPGAAGYRCNPDSFLRLYMW